MKAENSLNALRFPEPAPLKKYQISTPTPLAGEKLHEMVIANTLKSKSQAMNHNYVSISFPQQKVKLSVWETSQIKQAIDHQTAQIKKLTTSAITAISQGASP